VRMYRVGFGDFFLLSFLEDSGQSINVVVDCGVFKGTSQTGDIGSIEAAVADMARITAGKVALIIMTHRHADHIAGFARCSTVFKSLGVENVWMPVWESEYSPTATKFQAELTRTAFGLQAHFAAFGAKASEAEDTARKYMENAIGEVDAAGRGMNSVALDLLKHGFAGVTPSYYQAGDKAQIPRALVDAGLTAQILGPPPIADLDLMKLMDLKKGVGQYLTDHVEDDVETCEPFGIEWQVKPFIGPVLGGTRSYSPEAFREWVTRAAHPIRKAREGVTIRQARRARSDMEKELQQSQSTAALTAAKQLNSFLNNQSLVVFFTFKTKKLLFVGDAQAGNWEHWLYKTDKPDKAASGSISDAAQQILTSLDFYKVGHHGSGNATPKAAVDMMGIHDHRFVSMCSTQAGVYGTEDPDDPNKGTEVPRGPLVEKLRSESSFVRSDQVNICVGDKTIAAAVPAPLPTAVRGGRLVKGDLWVDCYL
jgi:hypothetical protein